MCQDFAYYQSNVTQTVLVLVYYSFSLLFTYQSGFRPLHITDFMRIAQIPYPSLRGKTPRKNRAFSRLTPTAWNLVGMNIDKYVETRYNIGVNYVEYAQTEDLLLWKENIYQKS